jgi:hypothetical protein
LPPFTTQSFLSVSSRKPESTFECPEDEDEDEEDDEEDDEELEDL